MRVKAFIPTALVLLLLTGCGADEPHTVPDVVGQRLDVAQERLDERGLGYETIGGGALGIVVSSNWTVCEQSPAPGVRATRVELVVDRWCPTPPPPAPRVPYVEGLNLSEAERRLHARGIEAEPFWLDDSDWYEASVCEQHPRAGTRAHTVELEVAELCAV
jgi:beta-lactam-binding protein with PASTA domain